MVFYVLIIIFGVALDQLTKYLAATYLAAVYTVPIIPHVFHLTYVENNGAAFGIFGGRQIFLIVLTLIFVVLLFWFLLRLPKNRKYYDLDFAVALIIAGAVGNLIDRIRLNYVIDFFDIRLIGFAIFNVADVFVVCGCLLALIALLRNKELLDDAPAVLSRPDKKPPKP